MTTGGTVRLRSCAGCWDSPAPSEDIAGGCGIATVVVGNLYSSTMAHSIFDVSLLRTNQLAIALFIRSEKWCNSTLIGQS